MPKSKHIGRKMILSKAREYAGSRPKKKKIAFDGFMNGVEWIMDELDGKTIVMDRDSSTGDYVKAGTITGSFSWAMRGIDYGSNMNDSEKE